MAKVTIRHRARTFEMLQLTDEQIDQQARAIVEAGEPAISELRGIVRAMIGPDAMFLPESALTDPGSFYIDDRCGGFAYPDAVILQTVRILARVYALAGRSGLKAQMWLNLGVF